MVVFKFDFDPKVVLIKADVFITLPERLKLHLGWLKETISPFTHLLMVTLGIDERTVFLENSIPSFTHAITLEIDDKLKCYR